jgi:GTP pyrophosphokinase
MVTTTYNLLGPEQNDQATCDHWLETVAHHYGAQDHGCLVTASQLLLECRHGQLLETGESITRHRLSTADILFSLRMDCETLCAALLNGCLALQGMERLRNLFGDGMARMVNDLERIGQLTNIERIIASKDQQEHEENLRRLLLGIAEDVRVVLIVLAERLHLMRVAKHLTRLRQISLAQDTQRVYAPLANRLGIWQIKWELEDLTLRYLEPDEYKRLARLLSEKRTERQAYIGRVISLLQDEFNRAGLKATINGRPKHLYSIWRKMQRKRIDIEQIFDLRALRVMVDDIPACYAALGIVHGLWKHIPKEFDDYIATPKGNMYQSLHTAVIGPEDKPLEVQIRTYTMHQHAEFGVAAHWAYKESKNHDAEFQRRVVWMRHWLELKNEGDQTDDFVERFKAEFEPVHVYVLTPQAKVIELPKGATPLDFAYAIHSEIGHRCRGARVDDRIVPLTYQLSSGEMVEILTQKNAMPSRDWLSPQQGYMVTSRARNRVRQWFKAKDYDRHVLEGRSLVDKELARHNLEGKLPLEKLAVRYHVQRGDDVLAAVGRGDINVTQIIHYLKTLQQPQAEPSPEQTLARIIKPSEANPTGVHDVVVEGVADLMTSMASCCKPVPYDKIIGFITRGRGITIHRRNCKNIVHLPETDRERLIDVHWSTQPCDLNYPVDVSVIAADRRGLLRDISALFSDADINVVAVTTHTDPSNDIATLRFTAHVSHLDQLEQVLTKLRQLPDILDVKRCQDQAVT